MLPFSVAPAAPVAALVAKVKVLYLPLEAAAPLWLWTEEA